MHHRMLVTYTASDDATSEQVRHEVFGILSEDSSFSGPGGRFGAPLCDWFVVGGRWSGYLSERSIGDTFHHAVVARFPEMGKPFFPMSLIAEHGETLDALWKEHGGPGLSPYTRSRYDHHGAADDAMFITQSLYDSLLKPFAGESIASDDSGYVFADLDEEALEPSVIGNKWLIVIDYHD